MVQKPTLVIIPSHEYDLPETYPSISSKESKVGKHKHRKELNGRSIASLKAECENAMAEAQSLKRQQEETVKRYKHSLKETEKSVLQQLQHSRNSEELRNFRDMSGNDSHSSDQTDILSKYKETEAKACILLEEDNMKIRKQYNTVLLEKESAYAERTAAIRDLEKVTQQRDEAYKVNSEYAHKVSKLHKECEEAKQDQYLVLSERDNVLKEINQLQDECNESRRKVETFEKHKKSALEEIEKLKLDISQTKKERDQFFKDREDIFSKYVDLLPKNFKKYFQLAKERHDAVIVINERIIRETYERERSRKEPAEDGDHDSKETEKLKKHIGKRVFEKLQQDLHDALSEVEKYKKSRDWAISCREKRPNHSQDSTIDGDLQEWEMSKSQQKPYPYSGRHYDVPLPSYSREITREPGVNTPQIRRPVECDNRERHHHFSGPHSKSSQPSNSHNSRMSTSSPRWSSDTSTFDSLHSPPYYSDKISSTSSFPWSRGSYYGSTGMSPVTPLMPYSRRPSPSFPDWCSSPSPSQISSTPSDNMLYPSNHESRKSGDYDHSTFPSKIQSNRIWIPASNQSVASTGSVEVVSARSSPGSPMLESENIVGTEAAKRRLHRGQTRTIYIQRTSQPVGFQIASGPKGGMFVSSVNENSLAAKAGLVIGDQFLEICGINMRTASQEIASQILKQVGNSLTLLVQYNPDEYYNKNGDSSGEDSTNTSPKNTPGLCTFKCNHNGTGSSGRNKTPGASIVETLAVLGAGLMGAGIVQVSVDKGYHVILKDMSVDGLARGEEQVATSLNKLSKRKKITSKVVRDSYCMGYSYQ